MESGCLGCFGSFGNVLRDAWASLRNRIRHQGVRQRRRNYRISKMEAIKKLGRKRGRGQMENMDVVRLGARTTKKKIRRAELQAAGWKQRRDDPEVTGRELKEKINTILLDFQRRRKAQRVRERAQRPYPVDITSEGDLMPFIEDPKTANVPQELIEATADTHCGDDGNSKTNVLNCCPLRGKKAHCGKWQDMVLEGIPMVQANMDKSCVPVIGTRDQKPLRQLLCKMNNDNGINSPTLPALENGIQTGQLMGTRTYRWSKKRLAFKPLKEDQGIIQPNQLTNTGYKRTIFVMLLLLLLSVLLIW